MKKVLFVLLSILILTGCNSKLPENSESTPETTETTSTAISTTTAETVTKAVTDATEPPQPVFTEISENIRVYDLCLSENSELIPAEEKRTYAGEIEMPNYGVISNADGKISLITNDRTKIILTETPYADDAYSWLRLDFAIDDSRFAYSICNEWGNSGFGVYDLDSGEDRQILRSEEYCDFPRTVCENSLILAKRGYFDFLGFSKCDLETFEVTDIDLPIDCESMKIRANTVSENGSAAVLSMEFTDDDRQSVKYTVTVMSLNKCEILGEFTFESDGEYVSTDLEFVSENELYLYAKRYDKRYDIYVKYVYNLYEIKF